MTNPKADQTVEIVSSRADYKVQVVGDQVVDLTDATPGDVLVVQPDGSLAPAPASGVGAVSSVNTRTGAVTGLAEQTALTTEVSRATTAEATKADAAATTAALAGKQATIATGTYAQSTGLAPSSFTPRNIPGLAMWFDPARVTSLADGAALAALPDLSGNGRDLLQATGGNQPTWMAKAGPGGQPVVRFAVGKFLQTAAFAAAIPQPSTVFVVCNFPATLQFAYDGSSAGNRWALFSNAGLAVMHAGSGNLPTATWPVSTTHGVFTAVYDGANSLLRVNGANAGSGNGGTNPLLQLKLGQSSDGGTGYAGDVAAMLVFYRRLTPAEMSVIESGLATAKGVATRQTIPFLVNAMPAQVLVPPTYTSGASVPLVMFHHGAGEDETAPTLSLKWGAMDALLAAGYLITSSREHSENWGNQAALDDDAALYTYLTQQYRISRTVHLSESMGGVSGLLEYALNSAIPAKGWAGVYPVCDLDAMQPVLFNAAINTAYGSTNGTYAALSAGHNPMTLATSVWAGKRLRFYSSPSDVVAVKTVHSDPMAVRAAGAAENVVVACTGGHGDPSHWQGSDLVAFFARCV